MSSIMSDFVTVLPYLNGEKFNENMVIPYRQNGRVAYRNELLVEMCRGKRVLHIGCCDHPPLIEEKIKDHDWLHGLITECAEYTVGVDIDEHAIKEASRISGLNNLFLCDITADTLSSEITSRHFDIALFGEVVEHIPNPVNFLGKFLQNYRAYFEDVLITVPNAWRGGNIIGIFKNMEVINTDHRFFFTPFTIAKVAVDAGFKPKEIRMAAFSRAGHLKTMVLNKFPLLAEDIVFLGSH